jgi:NhaP-type Na+/H+ or K+/H+ antiporter
MVAYLSMLHENLPAALALIGIVILVSSLLSGLVERTGLPQVAIFLLLGVVLGPSGLDVVDFSLDSPALKAIATLGLVLVLFSDAIGVDTGEVRSQRKLALLILGPGTLIPAALIAVAAKLLLGLPAPAAVILGAALASTDPVLLRNVMRQANLPAEARVALRLESGMNDVVLLPIVVLCMYALHSTGDGQAKSLAGHAVGLFLLGPGLGALIGYGAITLLERVRGKVGVRRDYESLYALGVAFSAYAAAEAVGGSGFVAAFAAGIVIAALDVELCDCFLDYGQATAEMFLLLTFVAFGASLIWSGLQVAEGRTLVFALVALFLRTAALLPVLARAGVEPRSRKIIAWLGPRGLSSLLLVLLPVFAGVEGAERLFQITCLVVLLSVVIHGGLIAWFLRRSRDAMDGRQPAPAPLSDLDTTPAAPAVRAASAEGDGAPPERITLEELKGLWEKGEPVVVADVRTERSYRDDELKAKGAVRLSPDDAVRLARELRLPRDATIALYCT